MDGGAAVLAVAAAALPLAAGLHLMASPDALTKAQLALIQQPVVVIHWMMVGISLFGLVLFSLRGLFKPVSVRSLAASLGLLFVSLSLGAVRAAQTVPGWMSDSRVIGSAVAFLAFGGALAALKRKPKAAKALLVIGLLLIMLVAIMARTVPLGFHVFAVPL